MSLGSLNNEVQENLKRGTQKAAQIVALEMRDKFTKALEGTKSLDMDGLIQTIDFAVTEIVEKKESGDPVQRHSAFMHGMLLRYCINLDAYLVQITAEGASEVRRWKIVSAVLFFALFLGWLLRYT